MYVVSNLSQRIHIQFYLKYIVICKMYGKLIEEPFPVILYLNYIISVSIKVESIYRGQSTRMSQVMFS